MKKKSKFWQLLGLGFVGIGSLLLMVVLLLVSLFGLYWTFYGTSSVPQMVLIGSITGSLVSGSYFISLFGD